MSPFDRPPETEQQKEDRLYPWVTCCLCSKRSRAKYMEPTRGNMIQRKMCFNCTFWSDHLLNFILHKGKTPEGGTIIICKRDDVEGKPISHYTAYPYRQEGYSGMVGFGGDTWWFLVNSVPFRTNNMWHQGEVPEHFRELLPINALMITKTQYEEITRES